MSTYVRGLVAVATAAIALVLAPTSFAAPLFGFNDNSVGMRQATAADSAQLAANAGATASRSFLSWYDVEPQPGVLELDGHDQIYRANLARGIRPVFVLGFAPRWAWASTVSCAVGAECHYPPAPAYDAQWQRMVTTIVKRYPQLAALEIWNEPNLNSFWQGGIDPARYTSLLKQAHAAARAAGSQIPILGGAVSANFESSPTIGMPYATFLQKMYAAGAKGSMEGLSIHPYPDDIDFWRTYKMFSEVRDVRDAAGDAATKLWVTEVGASTNDPANPNYVFDGSSQAVILVSEIDRLRAMPDVAAVLVHTLISPTMFGDASRERGYGVVEPVTLTPKPAYCAIAKLNGTGYVCPAGVDTQLLTPGIQVLRWRAQHLLQSAVDAARAYRARTGSYAGLTSTQLHATVAALSATAAAATNLPGPTADPSRIGVQVRKNAAGQLTILLCNASQADRSYCVYRVGLGPWTYGKAEGSVGTAATAITSGRSNWW